MPDWERAIAEMKRVMKKEKERRLYLFVHLHPMRITEISEDGKEELDVRIGDFAQEELFDTLEAHQFEVEKGGLIMAQGYGQCGSNTQRLGVKATFRPHGNFVSWRDKMLSHKVQKVVDKKS